MTDSLPESSSRASTAWRPVVIAAVAVLAVGIGAVVGSFLLSARSFGAGPAAGYVPADAPMYFEWRAVPSEEQDAALRGILGRFPIPNFDADRPLVDQLSELLDEELAASSADFSYADDIATWWDGRLAVAYTEFPSMSDPMADPMMTELPGMLVLAGVTNQAAADDAIGRLRDAAGEGVDFSSTEHAGVTVWTGTDGFSGEWSYAITADQLVVAQTVDDVTGAIDRNASGADSIADTDAIQRLSADLPEDWLMFGTVNGQAMLDQMRADAEEMPELGAFYDALLEGQPLDSVVTVSATPDRLAFDAASDAPTGDLAVSNEDRGLASRVPADALVFADGGNLGQGWARLVTALKDLAASDPATGEGLGQAEAALGADLEELVSWIDDGAFIAGWDGSDPYGGILLVPSDAAAGRERVEGLLALARLATLDPSSGVSIEEGTVADTEVTTIRVEGSGMLPGGVPFSDLSGAGLAVQIATTDDAVLIGFGETFVPRVLELDESESLAASDRYAGVIDELGGTSNVGAAWVDLTASREAIESTLLSSELPFFDYEADVKPWLVPFDRIVSVTRVDGDRVLQRAVLIFE